MFSDVISLILRDSDTDSENVSLRRGSVSDARKSAVQSVSLIDTVDSCYLEVEGPSEIL